MQRITKGTWGGLHIRIEVAEDFAATNYDCAHGTINGPLSVDSRGKFSLRGTFVRERGGPVRLDEAPKSYPVVYAGWTDGKRMTLTVTLAETNETVGTFTLVQGEPGRVFKCR